LRKFGIKCLLTFLERKLVTKNSVGNQHTNRRHIKLLNFAPGYAWRSQPH
jgi:hypothetical protein